MKEIEVCKVGKWPGQGGEVEVTKTMLEELAASYDPDTHQAPAVLGHPKTDEPALGWFEKFKLVGDKLVAIPRKISKELKNAIDEEKYKYVSLSFYHPTTPGNPKPGKYYVKHVGFLGAVPPAVKGLTALAEDEPDAVYLSVENDLAWSIKSTRSIFSKIRDFVIEKFGKEVADEVIPEWRLDSLFEIAERQFKTDEVNMSEKDKLEQLQKERDKLAAALAEQQAAVALNEATARIEAAIDAGKITPAAKDAAIDVYKAAIAPAELSEGESLIDKINALIDALPAIDMSEKTREVTEPKAPVGVTLPAGYEIDAETAEHLRAAQELAEKEGISVEAAFYKLAEV